MIRAVLFDLDDTLMPERDYARSGFRACAAALSGDLREQGVIAARFCELFFEDPRHVFDRFAAERGWPDQIASKCIFVYRAHSPEIVLSGEAVGALSELKAHGYLLGLVTDGRPEGQRGKIEALGLAEYMDAMVVTDELGGEWCRKPRPDGFLKALDMLGVAPDEAVYVADNPAKDFVAPNRLGIASICYTGANGLYARQPSAENGDAGYTVCNLMELLPLLKGALSRPC